MFTIIKAERGCFVIFSRYRQKTNISMKHDIKVTSSQIITQYRIGNSHWYNKIRFLKIISWSFFEHKNLLLFKKNCVIAIVALN